MPKLNTEQDKINVIRRKAINELNNHLKELWLQRMRQDDYNPTDLEMADAAYEHGKDYFYRVVDDRGIDTLYDWPELTMIMDHFEEGGTLENYHPENLVGGVERSVDQPVRSAGDTPKSLL